MKTLTFAVLRAHRGLTPTIGMVHSVRHSSGWVAATWLKGAEVVLPASLLSDPFGIAFAFGATTRLCLLLSSWYGDRAVARMATVVPSGKPSVRLSSMDSACASLKLTRSPQFATPLLVYPWW